jgi:hypothetical protein
MTRRKAHIPTAMMPANPEATARGTFQFRVAFILLSHQRTCRSSASEPALQHTNRSGPRSPLAAVVEPCRGLGHTEVRVLSEVASGTGTRSRHLRRKAAKESTRMPTPMKARSIFAASDTDKRERRK